MTADRDGITALLTRDLAHLSHTLGDKGPVDHHGHQVLLEAERRQIPKTADWLIPVAVVIGLVDERVSWPGSCTSIVLDDQLHLLVGNLARRTRPQLIRKAHRPARATRQIGLDLRGMWAVCGLLDRDRRMVGDDVGRIRSVCGIRRYQTLKPRRS